MASKKYESNKQKFADKLFAAYPDLGDTADAVFAKIASYDPTADYKNDNQQYVYLEWIASRVLKEKPRAQDLYKIKEDLELYTTLSRLDKYRASREGTVFYRPFVNPQIGQYTIASLGEATLPYINKADRKKSSSELEEERRKAEAETRILYDGPEGRIVVPTTMEASQFWGKGTKWCIAATKADNLFEKYYQEGKYPLIMFLPKGVRDKFAFNEYDTSSARNMVDVGIVDPYLRIQDDVHPDVIILGDLLAAAITSPNFKMEEIEKDPNLARAFDLFAIWNAPVYRHVAQKVGNDNLPQMLKPEHLLSFCTTYIGSEGPLIPPHDDDELEEERIDEKIRLVRNFASIDSVIIPLTSNPAFKDLRKDVIDASEWGDTEKIIGNMADNTITLPATPFENMADYIADFVPKYRELERIRDLGDDVYRDMVSERMDEATIAYMKAMPPAFWEDEELSLKFIVSGDAYGSSFVDQIPAAYNHPKVLHHLFSVMDLDVLTDGLKDHDFSRAWNGKIDGIPVLETIMPLPDAYGGALIEMMADAVWLYEAMGPSNVDNLDMSPIVRKVEELYPDGFDDSDHVEDATFTMSKCDFTALLEKTIARHPEFFEDVAPERQTMPMAVAAVQHDPGSLADISAHLFKGTRRPPELTAAFNKLPPGSMERAAVADYFQTLEAT